MGSLLTITSSAPLDADRLLAGVKELAAAGRIPANSLLVGEMGLAPDGKTDDLLRITRFAFDLGAARPLTLHIERSSGRIAAPVSLGGGAISEGMPCRLEPEETFAIADGSEGSYREHIRAVETIAALNTIEGVRLEVSDSTGFAEHRDETRLIAEMALALCASRALLAGAKGAAWN